MRYSDFISAKGCSPLNVFPKILLTAIKINVTQPYVAYYFYKKVETDTRQDTSIKLNKIQKYSNNIVLKCQLFMVAKHHNNSAY